MLFRSCGAATEPVLGTVVTVDRFDPLTELSDMIGAMDAVGLSIALVAAAVNLLLKLLSEICIELL